MIAIAYQINRHLAAHMARWPAADREATRAAITRRVKTGQSWFWPVPTQGVLFA